MGHPVTLLNLIAEDVRQSYPEPEYRFAFEKPLRLSDRRNQPDIQVFDAAGSLCCAVEIGYTRPEKLEHYHLQGIPDVRWYDKQGRLIPLKVGQESAPIHREVIYVTNPDDIWRVVPSVECPNPATNVYGEVVCDKLTTAVYELQEAVRRVPKSESRLKVLLKARHWPVWEEHNSIHPCDWREFLEDDTFLFSEWSNPTGQNTWFYFYTNGAYGFIVNWCDECGEASIHHCVP